MNVFVFNAGSSSFKAAYFENRDPIASDERPVWSGEIRWWSDAPERAELRWQAGGKSVTTPTRIGEHGAAASLLLDTAAAHFGIAPDLIAHRVVHGLDLAHAAIVDDRVLAKINAAAEIAPLHNGAALAGIAAGRAHFPAVPQAAVFDTAFHATLPREAAAFAGPYDWFAREGIRRYGFHGISHQYCAGRTADVLQIAPADLTLVSIHLGNGCSLAAIRGGRSVDTTMGFTPLDGLMMGTRSGAIDPGLLLYLIGTRHLSATELETILNTESGLKGISGVSEDMRDIASAARAGNDRAQFAIDLFVHRLCGGIAAMMAATNGAQAIAFTGGMGEHDAALRERVCAGLGFLGVGAIQPSDTNAGDREIGDPRARVRIAVIEAREDLAIARAAELLLARVAS